MFMAANQRLRRAIMDENAAGRPKIFSVFSMGDRYFQGRLLVALKISSFGS